MVSVTVPDSVTVIEAAAFSKCAALTSVTLPEKMLYVGPQAFAECAALKEITLPATGITEYSASLFLGSAVEKVTLPEGVELIPASAFFASNLKEITLREQHPWNGLRIRELDISRQTIIVMVERRGRMITPRGDLTLKEGDQVLLYTQTRLTDADVIPL